MKNQWPFWLFVIAIAIVVVISLNYQGKNDAMPLEDIFPGDQVLDYEYIKSPDQKDVPAVAKTEASDTAAVSPAKPETQGPAVKAKAKPVASVAAAEGKKDPVKSAAPDPSGGPYSVQVASSKDRAAMEKTLEKAKAEGFSDAHIGTADLGEKGTWCRLYIGSYASMAQARERLPKIKEKYSQAFIIKLAE